MSQLRPRSVSQSESCFVLPPKHVSIANETVNIQDFPACPIFCLDDFKFSGVFHRGVESWLKSLSWGYRVTHEMLRLSKFGTNGERLHVIYQRHFRESLIDKSRPLTPVRKCPLEAMRKRIAIFVLGIDVNHIVPLGNEHCSFGVLNGSILPEDRNQHSHSNECVRNGSDRRYLFRSYPLWSGIVIIALSLIPLYFAWGAIIDGSHLWRCVLFIPGASLLYVGYWIVFTGHALP